VNHASLSELGRHPLHYDIVKSLLKYCYRLENLTTEFPLLKDAFLCSNKFVNRKLEKKVGGKSVPRAPVICLNIATSMNKEKLSTVNKEHCCTEVFQHLTLSVSIDVSGSRNTKDQTMEHREQSLYSGIYVQSP
jgi:hypothetical protein